MSDKTPLYVEDLIVALQEQRGCTSTHARDAIMLGKLWALVPPEAVPPAECLLGPKFKKGDRVQVFDGRVGTVRTSGCCNTEITWPGGHSGWWNNKDVNPAPLDPAPKFKKGDWVVLRSKENGTRPYQVRDINHPGARSYGIRPDGEYPWIEAMETSLLAIPPKPEKTDSWYDLTGEVRIPTDQDEWIGALDEAFQTTGTAALVGSRWGGFRWLAKRNSKCTECGQEMPK